MKYVYLKIAYDTENPQKTFNENLLIIKAACQKNYDEIHFILKGNKKKIQILEIADYYSFLVSNNPSFKYLIVFDQKIEEKKVLNIKFEDTKIEKNLNEFKENYVEEFSYTASGGTFDRIHEGHKLLLFQQALISNKILVGITTNSMSKNKKFSEMIEDYDVRKKNVIKILYQINPLLNVKIVEIFDGFGPTIVEPEIDSIVGII
jgi:cytidyltransferase-like protein